MRLTSRHCTEASPRSWCSDGTRGLRDEMSRSQGRTLFAPNESRTEFTGQWSHTTVMEAIPRFSQRLLLPSSLSHSRKLVQETVTIPQFRRYVALKCHRFQDSTSLIQNLNPFPRPVPIPIVINAPTSSSQSRNLSVRASWLMGLGEKKKPSLPDIVKAGDPVLHEPARELDADEIRSERVQNIIDDMIKVMRKAPGVGLAAPQIGIAMKVIVLEDTKEYISYAPKEETKTQDRRPFDLLVVVNPKLKPMSDKKAIFFEGCLSVDGYRAAVERFLEVEVSGLDRFGEPIKVKASGWQARIFQHECDHLDGTLYVDKMVKRTFRTVENLDLPLAVGCPKLGPC